jgi:hypothetical protein
MSARGIGLMALGALGTAALIGVDAHGVAATTLMVVAGLGTLTAFALGSLALVRGRGDRAEVARVDELADGVEQEARGHLLRGREAELVRQIETLELRRDQALAEAAAAASNAGSGSPAKAKNPRKPKLVMVASND